MGVARYVREGMGSMMHTTKPTPLAYFNDAGVPKLKTVQNAVVRVKRGKVAGLQLTTRADLLQFCSQNSVVCVFEI